MSDKFKAFCNHCNTITNHHVKLEHKIDDVVDDQEIQHYLGTYKYQIIECNGCETISYRSVDYFPTFGELNKEGKIVISNSKTFETFYPERIKDQLAERKIVNLPTIIRKAYREVIDAYNFDQNILCAAGLRAIVEGICAHYKINSKTLGEKIDLLNPLIGKELSEALKIHKSLGNYALHRLDIPEKVELEEAIHLVEHSLETLFEIPIRSQKLRESLNTRITKTSK